MDDQTDLHRLADALIANARDLEADLDWLVRVLQARLAAYFDDPSRSPALPARSLPPPALDPSHSPYAAFLHRHDVAPDERLLLILALTPHLRPQLLDGLWTRNAATQRGFTEFGGLQAQANGSFLPTGETAAFVLGGDDLAARFIAMRMLGSEGRLAQLDLVHLAAVPAGEPALAGALHVSRAFLGLVTHGVEAAPDFGPEFPARRVSTPLAWEDLVLPSSTLEQIDEIRVWLRHGPALLDDWGMRRRLRPGYVSLFVGPPGVGKTACACLLGKMCGDGVRCRDVYRVDLSMVLSKFIGESEKALARLFDQAEHRGWILFFDEADALFAKRARLGDDVHSAYSNNTVSFLLQRVEEFDGVVILASNFRHNIDEAFLRRFDSVVHFPAPKGAERLRIWRSSFPQAAQLEASLDLARIAEQHEITGGTIVNVARHASLRALARGDGTIRAADVERGIQRELIKEGRAL